jgi:2,4-dienoyl-CoA reductase-like NADH-dependent reductase (Old Yellow Enzyme family)
MPEAELGTSFQSENDAQSAAGRVGSVGVTVHPKHWTNLNLPGNKARKSLRGAQQVVSAIHKNDKRISIPTQLLGNQVEENDEITTRTTICRRN